MAIRCLLWVQEKFFNASTSAKMVDKVLGADGIGNTALKRLADGAIDALVSFLHATLSLSKFCVHLADVL